MITRDEELRAGPPSTIVAIALWMLLGILVIVFAPIPDLIRGRLAISLAGVLMVLLAWLRPPGWWDLSWTRNARQIFGDVAYALFTAAVGIALIVGAWIVL